MKSKESNHLVALWYHENNSRFSIESGLLCKTKLVSETQYFTRYLLRNFPNPDLTNTYNHTTNGSGTGYYSSSFSLLVGSGTYYIRAYATNTNGTSYGEQVTIAHPYDTLPSFMFDGHTYRVAPDPGNTMTWSNANTYCNGLELYGYSDWRLPTKDELYQMYIFRNSIGGFNCNYYNTSLYWSSTVQSGYADYYWYCNFNSGSQSTSTSGSYRVRPIRVED